MFSSNPFFQTLESRTMLSAVPLGVSGKAIPSELLREAIVIDQSGNEQTSGGVSNGVVQRRMSETIRPRELSGATDSGGTSDA